MYLSTGTALRAFYFLFYGFYGVILPYLPIWLASRGLDRDTVGVVIAAAFLPKILSQPLFAHYADKTGQYRRLMLLVLTITIGVLALFALGHAPAWLLFLTLTVHFFVPAVMPLMDRAALAQMTQTGTSQYTQIRLWGSLGFAVCSLAGGMLIDRAGANGVLTLGVLLALGCVVICRHLPAAEMTGAEDMVAGTSAHGRWPVLDILRDRRVMGCIVASALVQASNGYLYSYASLYWVGQGLTLSQIGALWTVGIASEVFFFMQARKILARVSATHLIVLSAVMTTIRWTALSMTHAWLPIAAFQLLQGFTLAGNNMAIMAFLAQTVRADIRTTAIALYTMLSAGVFMFGSVQAVNAAGAAITGWGFGGMAICAALAIPIVLVTQRRRGQ